MFVDVKRSLSSCNSVKLITKKTGQRNVNANVDNIKRILKFIFIKWHRQMKKKVELRRAKMKGWRVGVG